MLDCARLRGVQLPVCVLSPAEVAETVRPVEEARLKDFFVQTCAVEAQLHRMQDVVFQIVIGRRRVNAVRVEALIQHPATEHHASVDAEGSAHQRHAPQAEIACCAVGDRFPLCQRQLHVIQIALSDLPQMLFGQRNRYGHAVCENALRRGATDLPSRIGDPDRQSGTDRVAVTAQAAASGVVRTPEMCSSSTASIHTVCQMPVVRV